jgi:hypothetical protein
MGVSIKRIGKSDPQSLQKTKILNERETDTGSRPTTMLRRKEERKESKKEDEVGNGIKKDPVRSAGTEAPGSSASREIPCSHGLVQ